MALLIVIAIISAIAGVDREAPVQEPAQEEPAQEQQQEPVEEEPVEEEAATVQVTGDTSFSCSVGNIQSQRTVDGTAPASFEVPVDAGVFSGDAVTAACQNMAETGTLGVQIVYDGEVRAENQTTAQFGTVNVSWSLAEQ